MRETWEEDASREDKKSNERTDVSKGYDMYV